MVELTDPVQVKVGDNWRMTLVWAKKNDEGEDEAMDTIGLSFLLQVRDVPGGKLILEATNNDYIDAEMYKIKVNVPPSVTSTVRGGKYFFDFQVSDGQGLVKTLLTGKVHFSKDVNYG